MSVINMVRQAQSFFQAHRRLLFALSYGASNFLPVMASFVLVLIYTSALSVSEFGRLNVLTAIVAFLSIVVELGVPAGILREYCDRHREARVLQYLSDAICGYKIISLAIMPVAAVLVFLLWPLPITAVWRTCGMIAVLLCITYFERLAETHGAVGRAIEAPSHFLVGRAVNSTCTVAAAIVIVVYFHGGVLGALLARMFGAIAAFLVYSRRMSRQEGIGVGRFRWQQMRAVLAIGLPLTPNRLALWTQQQGLKPVLTQVVLLKSVAQFSLASAVAFMPLMVTNVLDMVLSPVYFKRRVDLGELFEVKVRRLATVMMAAELFLFSILILFARELVVAIGGSRYVAAAPACALLFCAAFLRAMSPFLSRQILYSRKTWMQPAVTIPSAVLAVLVTLLAAGRLGFMAAAWALFLSEAVNLVGFVFAVSRIDRPQLPILRLFGFLGFLLALAGVVGFHLLPEDVLASLAMRLGLIAGIGAGVYAIWIAPNWVFIRDLIRG